MTDTHIKTLLNAWGRFRREGWNPKIGYDKINILAKAPGGNENEEIPAEIIKADRFIGTMPSNLNQVLRQYYEKRRSLRKGAKKLAISKNKFSNLLRDAEQRVTGYMSIINIRDAT